MVRCGIFLDLPPLLWQLFDINIKMFLRDNFVHGDLHAGNLLYDAASHRITVLDAGLTTSLPPVSALLPPLLPLLPLPCAQLAESLARG
jgi:hypothetical protein